MSTATIPTAATPLTWWRSMRSRLRPLFCGGVDPMRRRQDSRVLRSPTSRQDGGRKLLKAVPISMATAGDDHGFSELYHHRRLALVRLALLLVDDLPSAEDVVQDAFAALLRRHGRQLADLDDPEAYLRTSSVHTPWWREMPAGHRASGRGPMQTCCLRGPHADQSLPLEAGRELASGSCASSAEMRYQRGRPEADLTG